MVWDFKIQTDTLIQTKRLSFVNNKKICQMMDVSLPFEHRANLKKLNDWKKYLAQWFSKSQVTSHLLISGFLSSTTPILTCHRIMFSQLYLWIIHITEFPLQFLLWIAFLLLDLKFIHWKTNASRLRITC